MLRIALSADSLESLRTDPQRRTLIRLSLHLVPFAGIAFLRFTSAVSRWVCYVVGLTLLVASGACRWTRLAFLA